MCFSFIYVVRVDQTEGTFVVAVGNKYHCNTKQQHQHFTHIYSLNDIHIWEEREVKSAVILKRYDFGIGIILKISPTKLKKKQREYRTNLSFARAGNQDFWSLICPEVAECVFHTCDVDVCFSVWLWRCRMYRTERWMKFLYLFWWRENKNKSYEICVECDLCVLKSVINFKCSSVWLFEWFESIPLVNRSL